MKIATRRASSITSPAVVGSRDLGGATIEISSFVVSIFVLSGFLIFGDTVSAESTAAAILVTAFIGSVGTSISVLLGAYNGRPVALATRLGLIYWLLIPALIEATNSTNIFSIGLLEYRYARAEVQPISSLMGAYYIFLFALVASSVDRHMANETASDQDVDTTAVTIQLSIVAVALGFFSYLAMSGLNPLRLLGYVLDGRSGNAPWDGNGIYGTNLTTVRNAATALIIGGASLLFVSIAANQPARRVAKRAQLTAIATFATAFVAIESGTRNQVALAIIPAALYLAQRLIDRTRTLRISRILALSTLAFLLLVSTSFLRQSRDGRDSGDAISIDAASNDFFSATALAVHITNESGPRLESPELLAIVQLIPNGIYPGEKPYSVSTVRFSEAKWGVDPRTGASQAFGSIVGQYLMSYGVIGPVLAGALVGLAASKADKHFQNQLNPQSLVVLAIGAFVFVSYRALFGAFGLALGVVAILAAASRRSRRLSQRFTPSA